MKYGIAVAAVQTILMVAASQAGADNVVINGANIGVKRSGLRAFAAPADLASQLKVVFKTIDADCAKFETAMQKYLTGPMYELCLQTNPDRPASGCGTLRTVVDQARYSPVPADEGSFVPTLDTNVSWQVLRPSNSRLPDRKIVVDELSRQLQLPASAIFYNDQPEAFSSAAGVSSVFGLGVIFVDGALTPKIRAIAEMTSEAPNFVTQTRTFHTKGLDVACDLLRGRAALTWGQAVSIVSENNDANVSADSAWLVRESLRQQGDLPGKTAIEQAAVAGGRLYRAMTQIAPEQIKAEGDLKLLNLVQVLIDGATLKLLPYDGADAFTSAVYPDSAAIRTTWTARN